MTRSEIIASMDVLAMEIARKIADYNRLSVELENLRALVSPPEDVPRNVDTHEMVSRHFGRRRTA